MRSSLIIYGLMTFAGLEICWWFHHSLPGILLFHTQKLPLMLQIVFVSLGFLLLGQLVLEDFFPAYRRLKHTLGRLFFGLNKFQILFLALISAIGEELLFRAGLQPALGIWFTSIIFAVLHVDPEGESIVWMLWAFIGGVVMGYAFEITHSIWAPILIHFCVNMISIFRISRLATTGSASPSSPE